MGWSANAVPADNSRTSRPTWMGFYGTRREGGVYVEPGIAMAKIEWRQGPVRHSRRVGLSPQPPPTCGEHCRRLPRWFRFGEHQSGEERGFMPATRGGISEPARQSWSDSNSTLNGGGLVAGSVGVAIPGASYGLGGAGLVHQLLAKRKFSNQLASASFDERALEHRVGWGKQIRDVDFPQHS